MFSSKIISLLLILLYLGQSYDAATQAEQLYHNGKTFLEQGNYLGATMYLFAFLNSDSKYLKNAEFATAVNDGYSFAQKECNYMIKEYPNVVARYEKCKEDLSSCKNPGIGMSSSGLTLQSKPPELPNIPAPKSIKTYPLVLKGGPDIKYIFNYSSTELDEPHFVITFPLKWQKAAGKELENISDMPKGSAAWLDRPIADAEPSRILFPVNVKDLSFKAMTSELQVSLFTFSGKLKFLNALEKTGAYVSFSVYSNGKGCFIATGVLSYKE